MIDEKAIPLEAITAAEVELARVLKGFDYCMPAVGMQRVLTAALSALRPGSTGDTDGRVLVPKEPTEAMLVAVTADLRGADHMPGSYDLTDADWAKRFYRAMLAAAGGRDE